MTIKDVLLIIFYVLPVFIALDKNKLKVALLTFIILIIPIYLNIYIDNFDFFALSQLGCWIISMIILRFFGLFNI